MLPPALVPTAAAATTATATALPHLSSSLVKLCAQAAPLVSIALLAAPLPTIQSVKQQQSVGALPLLPYSSMAVNCALWGSYGVLQQQIGLMVPNLLGLSLAFYYMTSFLKIVKTNDKNDAKAQRVNAKPQLVVVATVLLTALWAIISPHYIRMPSINPAIMGRAAVTGCMIMYASPLATLRTVLQTKSAGSIPLPFTLASVANCFLWSVTGIFQLQDFNIVVPNVTGLALGLVQVVLKLVYRNSPEVTDVAVAREEEMVTFNATQDDRRSTLAWATP